MRTVRTRPQYSLLNIRSLICIYILLCALTIVFFRSFFSETLYKGTVPNRLNLAVFFTIPAVLLIFLGIAAASIIGDIIVRRPGIKFKARLLGYFILIVIFTAVPMTTFISVSISEVVRFWHSIETDAAGAATQSFAVDNFFFHEENFEDILRETDWNRLMREAAAEEDSNLPSGITAVQDFKIADGAWQETAFAGAGRGRLDVPPSEMEGPVTRELPRDLGFIRYVKLPAQGIVRLITYDLGEDFDRGMAAIQKQEERFAVIGILRDNVLILTLFYYGVFFFPTLLMTIIIAISFTRRVTNPIVELTEATRRVAEGDFSIQILTRRGDELGLLIRSFNAMVQNLEKSRAALVKAEKISIWQNMAQQLAHEIKNPLTPIKLSAERVLRRWHNEPEQTGEIIESSMLAIIQETEGLSTLLNEFRTLSKPAEPSRSWTGVGETVEEAVNLYRGSYPGVLFDVEHITAVTTIKIDKHRLMQVLTNLLINAIDSMSGKGRVEIRTGIIQKREMRFCRLTIKDSGIGISREAVPRVFTPYYTTKESGTGLGLPIIERIVNDHGGSIWLNSAEGMGTTFFVDLPAGGEEA